jgi:drug/metabolite transporter (DMT)-like permease
VEPPEDRAVQPSLRRPRAALGHSTPWAWSARVPVTRHGPDVLWRLLALSGLTAIGSILFVAGVRHAGVAVATVLSSTSPMFAIPLGLLFLGERVSSGAIVGTLLTVAGIAVLQF